MGRFGLHRLRTEKAPCQNHALIHLPTLSGSSTQFTAADCDILFSYSRLFCKVFGKLWLDNDSHKVDLNFHLIPGISVPSARQHLLTEILITPPRSPLSFSHKHSRPHAWGHGKHRYSGIGYGDSVLLTAVEPHTRSWASIAETYGVRLND